MATIEVRCRQCGWTRRVAADLLPRYGVRVRCPHCDALQLVLAGPAGPLPTDELAGLDAASTPIAASAPDTPRAPDEASAPDAAAAVDPLPPSATPPAAGKEAPPEDPGAEDRAQCAEARQLLRLWLAELLRQTGGPLDMGRVFGEHGDELAHLYALWKDTHPGEHSEAIFRRQLLGALASLAGQGAPSSSSQGPSRSGR